MTIKSKKVLSAVLSLGMLLSAVDGKQKVEAVFPEEQTITKTTNIFIYGKTRKLRLKK